MSRALNDEIEQVCEDHCGVRFECGYNDDLRTVEECVAQCVPSVKEDREECLAQYELTRCQSQLSCEEGEAYAAGIDGYARTAVWPPEFPCRDEAMEHLRICFPD